MLEAVDRIVLIQRCDLVPHIDMLKGGVWQLLKDVDDPELRKLADALPNTVLRSRATSDFLQFFPH